MRQTIDEELIRRYLLGTVTLDEQDEIQDRLFSDSEFLDRLLLIEDELIHDYVLGTLTPDQRGQVEEFFLRSPERQRRLKVSEQLKEFGSRVETRTVANVDRGRGAVYWRWVFLRPRIAVAAVIIVLAAALFWHLRDMRVLKKQIAELGARQEQQEYANQAWQQLARERAENQELRKKILETEQEVESLKVRIRLGERRMPGQSQRLANLPEKEPDPDEHVVASAKPVELWPDARRGAAAPNSVRIEAGAREVVLQLNLEEGVFPRYSVEARDAENKKLWNISNVKAAQTASGKALIVNVPARLFTTGDYVLMVRGGKTSGRSVRVDSYQFRVDKE